MQKTVAEYEAIARKLRSQPDEELPPSLANPRAFAQPADELEQQRQTPPARMVRPSRSLIEIAREAQARRIAGYEEKGRANALKELLPTHENNGGRILGRGR